MLGLLINLGILITCALCLWPGGPMRGLFLILNTLADGPSLITKLLTLHFPSQDCVKVCFGMCILCSTEICRWTRSSLGFLKKS